MSEQRPNIVLIMVDQMRHNCAGFAGNPLVKTPVLDRMAAQGVCFENTYCSSPLCSPARASWLTGLYPHAHTQLANYNTRSGNKPGYHLPAHIPTLGDVLHGAGYRCGIVGPWHLGNDETPQHGFRTMWKTMRYQDPETDAYVRHLEKHGLLDTYREELSQRTLPHMNFGVTRLPDEHQRTGWAVGEAIEFVRSTPGPFFLFVSIKDPHPHIYPPADMLALYSPEEIPDPPDWHTTFEGKPPEYRQNKRYFADHLTLETVRELIAHYFALITHIDNQLGRLFRSLEEMGIDENTMVAFISDHGEMLGEHSLFTKAFMYEGSVRVPCLLQWPGRLPAGYRVHTPFAGVDLFPSLLDLAGLEPPAPVHGRSVVPAVLEGRQPEPSGVLSEISHVDARPGMDDEALAATIMIREDRWKLVHHRYYDDELYDLEADPGELRNLAPDPVYAARYAHLRRRIADMLIQQAPGPYAWAATG